MIKFKAKSFYTDEWLFGDVLHGLDESIYIRHLCVLESEVQYKTEQVRPETICQYIETLESGQAVYENDWVQSDWGYGHYDFNFLYDVVCKQDWYVAKSECVISDNLKVVGNEFD